MGKAGPRSRARNLIRAGAYILFYDYFSASMIPLKENSKCIASALNSSCMTRSEISERVMQELFKALAMHFEFSLSGIMEAEK